MPADTATSRARRPDRPSRARVIANPASAPRVATREHGLCSTLHSHCQRARLISPPQPKIAGPGAPKMHLAVARREKYAYCNISRQKSTKAGHLQTLFTRSPDTETPFTDLPAKKKELTAMLRRGASASPPRQAWRASLAGAEFDANGSLGTTAAGVDAKGENRPIAAYVRRPQRL